VPDLALEILPPRVYVERTGVGQLLNFDLHLKNDGLEDVRLASVALEVLDGSGAVVLRRVVDEHGLRPAIETIPERNIPAGGSLLVFNPLHTFPPDLELASLCVACEFGDAAEAAARALDEAAVSGDRHAAATVRSLLASLEALRGDFEHARELYADARAVLEDLGLTVAAAQTAIESSRVEMLAGEPGAAEAELRRSYVALEAVGERYLLSTVAGLLGQALAEQGRYDEAEEFATIARDVAAEDDVDSQALWRSVHGRVLARKERFDDAERLVKEAVELLADTDGSLMQYGAWLALAEVAELAGNRQLAQEAADAAVRLAEQKESDVASALARERLAELTASRARDASALSP